MGSGVTITNTASVSQQDIIDSLTEQLAKAKEDYKTIFSAFESCQDELKESNERMNELESYNVKLANESHEYQQRVHKLERSLEERTQYINTLADSVQKDINRVWILDGFVEQVSKVDCESFTEVFLIKDTASRLLRKEQE